jgi:hypothetical protein
MDPEETAMVLEAIGDVNETLLGLTQQMAAMNGQMEHLTPMVESHQRILIGQNGTPGLISVTKTLAEYNAEHRMLLLGNKEDPNDLGIKGEIVNLRKRIKTSARVLWIVVGAAISAAVAYVASVL